MPKQRRQSNHKRCPLLKTTKKEYVYDSSGKIIGEEIQEELNDCYKKFCMAWNEEKLLCNYFDLEEANVEEEDDE
ncbi:MAG: hypothetical protein ACXABY_03860 [Candidatus Thorarchaeota archaeon]